MSKIDVKPKYNIKLTTWVVWDEVNSDDDVVGGAMTTLKAFRAGKHLVLVEPGCSVEVQYLIKAATGEEASAIRNLRIHGEPYYPTGYPETCPKCEDFQYFPKGSGECASCGKIC